MDGPQSSWAKAQNMRRLFIDNFTTNTALVVLEKVYDIFFLRNFSLPTKFNKTTVIVRLSTVFRRVLIEMQGRL